MSSTFIDKIIFPDDPYQMDWKREDFRYAEVLCPKGIDAQVTNKWEDGILHTVISLKNLTNKPIFTSQSSIGIRLPLPDKYESSEICMKSRCHTHLFCGNEISYVYALRMGGEAPHFGMVVTAGGLGGYSVERDLRKESNDRGCFILHPVPTEFKVGEEKKIEWKIFAHNGESDFYEKAAQLRPFLKVDASGYVIFPGETCEVNIQPSFPAKQVKAVLETYIPNAGVTAGMQETELQPEKQEDGSWKISWKPAEGEAFGDRIFRIEADGIHTECRILYHESPEKLAQKRCAFIAERQQYCDGSGEGLDGAYLIYDNQERHVFYDTFNDFNASRERVGMGMLMIAYLENRKEAGLWGEEEERLEKSLGRYTEFILRELFEPETGNITNDFGRDDSYKRLYNLPWFMYYFVKLGSLYQEKTYLENAYRIAGYFYTHGGEKHYSIELPVIEMCRGLKQAGMEAEYEQAVAWFRMHADQISEFGLNYPRHEVNFEQSIVAPAANILLQFYMVTREEKYLEAAHEHMRVLELFNGHQPDYHRYEVAIRHWDGYWFGKHKAYGDTFPHYWSGLSGSCFAQYYAVTGKTEYIKKAKDSLRGVLPMIFPDGSASCAYVFPVSVNGVLTDRYDVYANDQDWGLYFYERMKREMPEVLA